MKVWGAKQISYLSSPNRKLFTLLLWLSIIYWK